MGSLICIFAILSFFSTNFLIQVNGVHLGDNCVENLDCQPKLSRGICSNGKCICESGKYLDNVLNECRIKVGEVCDQKSLFDCVDFASCKNRDEFGNGTCTCKFGIGTVEGLCEFHEIISKKSTEKPTKRHEPGDSKPVMKVVTISNGYFNKSCSSRIDCINRKILFKCINKKCLCLSGHDYDGISCKSKPHHLCLEEIDYYKCLENSTCVRESEFAKGICLCKPGFHLTESGKCLSDRDKSLEASKKIDVIPKFGIWNPNYNSNIGFYGKNCSGDEDCENKRVILECLEGKCECLQNSSDFDEISQKCRSRIGHFCSDENLCWENANCYNSICLCNNGYHRNHDGKCISVENGIENYKYSAYAGWILTTLFIVMTFSYLSYVLYKRRWKKSNLTISYKNQENEGAEGKESTIEIIQHGRVK